MRVFAELYRRLDSATSTRAKQAALVDAFATARDDPAQRGSAAWMIYFLAGGKPRQTVPTRLLRQLAVELSGLPEWLCEECYHSVGDLAETLALLLPDRPGAEEVALATWMRERLLPLPALDEEQRYARLKDWVEAMPVDERLVFLTHHRRIAGRCFAAPSDQGAGGSVKRRREPHGAAHDRLCAGAPRPGRRGLRSVDQTGGRA